MIKLSDHFTYKRLLRFVASPILMMIFASVYSVVDGLFVSNFAGQAPFTALNLIFPFIMALGSVGFMFGSGGTAIVSKTMGEGENQLANRYFSLIVAFSASVGVVLAVLGIVLIEPVALLLGADAEILPLCKTYGIIVLCALPFFMLQNMFQNFMSAAEKPKIGFLFTVASGVSNIVLDALFVAVFEWGITGAAVATAVSQGVGGISPIVYFFCKNNSRLHFCKFRWYGKVVLVSCTNGISELLGNISMSVISMMYNKQLLRLVGNDGVAAYGVICYLQFVFVAIFIGYCIASGPIIGFNFGAKNKLELQNIFSKSMRLLAIVSVAMAALGAGLSYPLAYLFVGYNQNLCQMTMRGMVLFAASYLFVGFNMFGSSMFTALNNGTISAIISFARTLVLQIACIYLLPLWLGLDGVWISTIVAEGLAFAITVLMFVCNNKRYNYAKSRRAQNAENCLQEENLSLK